MKIAFNPSTVAALIAPPNNKDITFDLRGHNIFARGVKFCGTDTNTWRDIKINNVSIDSNILDLRDGDNTTLTNINGVVTINSTWRPVVDNLTSDSTTSSLSANLGRVLKALIDGKSDSGHNHDDRYVKKSGDTMLGALNFANGTWNLVGDDSYMGDCNISGHFGIKAANTTYPGIAFFNNANDHLGNLTAYNGNIKYGAYSLQFLDNGNTSVSASTWMNPFSDYNSNAVADGQAICVWGQASYLSNLAADSGDMSLWLKRVNANVATLNMVLDGEYYANGNLRLAHVSEIPNSLKNPYALTISLNGTSQGPYDGSAAKNINITPSSIGAATSDHNHDGRYVYNYGGTANVNGLALNQNALFMSTTSGITEDWWHILQAAWNDEYRWNSLIAFPTLNRNGMYYRSGLDDNTKWGSWVKLLDIGNSYVTEGKGVINGTTITQIDNADKVDGYHASSLWRSDGGIWNPGANISLTASENNQEWSFDIRRNDYTGCYWHVWDSALSTLLKVNADNGKVYAPYNFVGNLEGNAASATKSEYSRSLLGRSTSGNDYDTNSANLVFAEWNTMNDNRWYLKATGYECRVAYANNAGDASRVYGYVGDTGSHELVRCDMNNDQFRIIAGSSGNNNGWAEIATADDGTEPIYVRQYTGVFSSVVRTLTLLDANGYTHFPSYINIGGNENNNSSPDRVWGSNGSDSYLRSYRTSALNVNYAASASSATKVIVNLNTTNDANYPLVWSNLANTNTVTENQLYKSWSDLYYNPKNKRLTVGGSVVTSSFIKSGGNYSQLLRADGGIAAFNWSGLSGLPNWLWGGNNLHSYYVYNPSNFRVAYAASAGNADTATNAYHLRINSADTWSTWYWAGLSGLPSWLWGSNDGTNMYVWDPNNFNVHTALYLRSLGNLNCQTGRTLNYGDVYTYNTYDGNTGSPTDYTSVIGFGRGIAGTVEIAGGWYNTGLYWRSLRDCCEDWYSWRTVLDSSNYTGFVDNYYWANVKISTSSSTTTSPTVSNLTATSSIKMGNILLQNTDEINSNTGLYLNYRTSGNVSLCEGGGKVGIGTTAPSYKLDVNGLIRASGFYHSSVNSDNYILLAGGGYSQGVPVRYWAIYYIGIGNGSAAIICNKRSGNYNFITSEVWESAGVAMFDISFPSGYNKNNTLIFGNGDHHINPLWENPVYVTITTSTDFNTASQIKVIISDDKDPNTGYANIYFMCMG